VIEVAFVFPIVMPGFRPGQGRRVRPLLKSGRLGRWCRDRMGPFWCCSSLLAWFRLGATAEFWSYDRPYDSGLVAGRRKRLLMPRR